MNEHYWDTVSFDDPFIWFLFRIFSYIFSTCLSIILFSGILKIMMMFYVEAIQ